MGLGRVPKEALNITLKPKEPEPEAWLCLKTTMEIFPTNALRRDFRRDIYRIFTTRHKFRRLLGMSILWQIFEAEEFY